MKSSTLILAALAACSLGACVSPEQAAVNRAGFMERVFPNPADRQGFHLVFAVGEKFMVSYYPDQISEGEALYRISGLCVRTKPGTRAVHGPNPTSASIKDLGDGRKAKAHDFVAECI